MKTRTFTKYIMLMLLCLLPAAVSAQDLRITGVVTSGGEPVMMCNVIEVDANNRNVSYAQTDINGNFSMTIKNPKNKLRVSYIGCETFSTVIGTQRKFNIVLKDKTQIKEVVVRAQKKTNHGGLNIPDKELAMATQTFNMKDVEGMAFTSVDEALQGQIAGLDILSNSGNLGSGSQMRIRGITNINGNSNPLIVVDGNVWDNPVDNFDFTQDTQEAYAELLSVNPDDIVDVKVLSDAAATAIWGADGANGVIEITTKRGTVGKIRVTYSLNMKASWQPKGYNLLSGDDYTMMLKEMYYNPTQSPNATQNINEINYNLSGYAEAHNWDDNTDWVKAVSQVGFNQDHNLTISGGGEKARFYVSAGYSHQNGSIIEQRLDRFTTRLALDYFVSDRIKFSTTFPLTYTKNEKNAAGLLGIAQKLSPNMSIYREAMDANGNWYDTDEYYIMLPDGGSDAIGSSLPNTSAHQLASVRNLGNPVAIAHEAWNNESTYRIAPEFKLAYKLLGKEEEHTRLDYEGQVYLDIFSSNTHSFWPASLQTFNNADSWQTSGDYNENRSSDNGRIRFQTRHALFFEPYIKNQDWRLSMKVQGEMSYNQSTSQNVGVANIPDGISSPTLGVVLNSLGTGNGEGRSMNGLVYLHASYQSRYSLDGTLRADGTTKFGSKNKWGYFPALGLRWNVIEEPFMESLRPVLSTLGLRYSFGVTGNQPGSEYLQYTRYNTAGSYGDGGIHNQSVTYLEGLQLNLLKWARTTTSNYGLNVGFWDDRIEGKFEYYYKRTTDLMMSGIRIPSTSGFTSLANSNVGEMSNRGWELSLHLNDIIKVGKFSVGANFNITQNFNRIEDMDKNVLASLNNDWDASKRGEYLNRIQVGNPLGSIFGLRSQGVYQYSYEWLTDLRDENGWDVEQFRDYINNTFLASGKTAPIAVDEEGKVLINRNGDPVRMVYNYLDGNQTYIFQGGDAKYEDVNHDGQINAQDIVYLGNSNPKFHGGFGFKLRYGRWSLQTSFNYRTGCEVINKARMNLEQMFNANNQSTAVNFRWRQDGDVTVIPRAMYNTAYNFLGSDRYVETASYLRWNYVQVAYQFPTKLCKSIGLSNMKASVQMQNPFVWSHYSGTDPEHSAGAYGIATDNSQTPRPKQVSAYINITF